uniref:Uncharacterized protein n=1 Tax=Glossina pallidipes TaxID=7398 RepID=A0A1A9ZPZ8_GLOPL
MEELYVVLYFDVDSGSGGVVAAVVVVPSLCLVGSKSSKYFQQSVHDDAAAHAAVSQIIIKIALFEEEEDMPVETRLHFGKFDNDDENDKNHKKKKWLKGLLVVNSPRKLLADNSPIAVSEVIANVHNNGSLLQIQQDTSPFSDDM